MTDKLMIITGPTASGKSDLAIKLAKKFDGEIISADSQQIYKDMDIGTNKIKIEEMNGIKHYLLDIKNPYEEYSVQEFKNDVNIIIKSIKNKNKIPILVGGTGFYIDAILFDMNYGKVKKDEKIRKELDDLAEKYGNEYLYKMLEEIDNIEASKYHSNERQRIIRAIETYKVSGKKPSLLRKGDKKLNSNIDPLLFFINYNNRKNLYNKINDRVLDMIDLGLEEEFDNVVEKYNLNSNSKSLQAIGYKEFFLYKNKNIDKDVLIDLIQKNTRHYAKRQITWMKKYLAYDFSYELVSENLDYENIFKIVKEKYGI